MKLRKLLSLFLSCALLFGCTGNVFAVDDGAEFKLSDEDYVYYAPNLSLQNGMSGNLFHFRLDDTFNYAKIQIQNDSIERIRVSYTYKGNEYELGSGKYIERGSSKVFYIVGGRSAGAFYLNVSTINGYPIEGEITIKAGTKAGVDYPGI